MTQFTAGRRDYKALEVSVRRSRTRLHQWLFLIGGLSLLGSALGLLPDRAEATRQTSTPSSDVALEQIGSSHDLPADAAAATISRSLPLPPLRNTPDSTDGLAAEEDENAQPAWHTLKVGAGDSLARLFQRANIHAAQLQAIMNSGDAAKCLTQLHPGDTLRYQLDQNKDIIRLDYKLDETRELHILRASNGLVAKLLTHPVEIRHHLSNGEIQSSLYNAAQDAGLSDNLIMELASIFGWDIDFALDIRKGDRFTVLYENRYIDGEKIGDGDILAAEFINRGKSFRAVRYKDGNYYSPEGNSMRKAFLRSPVDFRRISSKFTPERWHPVLGKKRPHRGVDYAAAIGTPIKSAGDGKIIFRGTKGGYGRTVIVQHGTRYTTLYAHMSGFKKGQQKGSRVRQGDTIGYVGKSGLATGPHLHYEFRVNGVHRDPLTVKLPQAEAIAKQYRDDFTRQAAPLLARLDIYQRSLLALNSSATTP